MIWIKDPELILFALLSPFAGNRRMIVSPIMVVLALEIGGYRAATEYKDPGYSQGNPQLSNRRLFKNRRCLTMCSPVLTRILTKPLMEGFFLLGVLSFTRN